MKESMFQAVLEVMNHLTIEPFIVGMYGVSGKFMNGQQNAKIMVGYILFPEAGKTWRLIVNERVYSEAMTTADVITTLSALVLEVVNKHTKLALDVTEMLFPYRSAQDITLDEFQLDFNPK